MAPRLSGGTVVRYKAPKYPLAPNAEPPFLRVSEEGMVSFSTGSYLQLCDVSKGMADDPEPTHVEILIRKTDEGTFFVVAPVDPQENPLARPLVFPQGDPSKAPYVRGLKGMFREAAIQVRDGTAYIMRTEVAAGSEADADLGDCIYGNWTEAETEAIQKRGQ